MCYGLAMKTIPQRELRNNSAEILRKAETGQVFVISVGGRPVALLGPCPKAQWVGRAEVVAMLRSGSEDPTFFDDISGMADPTVDARRRWA